MTGPEHLLSANSAFVCAIEERQLGHETDATIMAMLAGMHMACASGSVASRLLSENRSGDPA